MEARAYIVRGREPDPQQIVPGAGLPRPRVRPSYRAGPGVSPSAGAFFFMKCN